LCGPNAVGVAAFRAIDGTPIGQFWAPYTREHPYGDLYGSPVVTDDALYLVPGWRGGYVLEPPELAWHGETVALERNFTPMLIDSLLVSEITVPKGVIDLLGAPVPQWPGSTHYGRAHSVTHIGRRPVVLKMDSGDHLVPFDLRTMQRIWRHQILPVGYYAIATENAVIIAGGHRDPYRAGVYVIDLLNGEELWEYARPNLSVRYLAFSAERLLAVAEDGFLYCFAPA
jgi:hypothetical protein